MILEPFAGAGGFSEALGRLGRHDTAGVELDPWACATATAAGHRRVVADVASFPLDHLRGRVEGIVAGPPCQSFSKAGKRGGARDQDAIYDHCTTLQAAGQWVPHRADGWADARSPLVLQPLRWVAAVRPQWVVCEQVPDVLPLWRAMARVLRAWGYGATSGVLSAERFGVPQTRERAFLVASLGRVPSLPGASHARYVPAPAEAGGEGLFEPAGRERIVPAADRGLLPWVSMADALGWAVERPARTLTGHRSPRWAYGQGAASYSTGWTLETEQRSETRDGRVPICREHDQPAPVVVANSYKWELHGDSRGNATIRGLDEPAATVFSSRSGNLRWAYRNGSRTNAAVRDLDEPAPTVHFGARGNQVDWVAERPATTVCADPRLAGPGHRDREGGQRQYDTATRRVTIREAAVLQSVRPDYPWRGNKTQQYQQAANMVPPLLGAAVVGELLGVDWRARLWGHDTEEVAG